MLEIILASVFFVSLLSFSGVVFLYFKQKVLNKILMVLVAFASGALLGSAFLDLLPESLALGETAFLYVLSGIVTFFVLEKFLYWRHCHIGKCEVHEFVQLNLIGDGVHNFIDGMIIATSFLSNMILGFTTTLAIAFHEIPQEIGDFGILVYGGLKRQKALFYNFVSALTAVAGALFAYFISTNIENISFLVPFAAGGFIYIASTDLIPELHKRNVLSDSLIQFVMFFGGILLMWALKTFLA